MYFERDKEIKKKKRDSKTKTKIKRVRINEIEISFKPFRNHKEYLKEDAGTP